MFVMMQILLGQPNLNEISTQFRAGSDTHGIGPYLILTIVPILVAIGITAFYQNTKGVLRSSRSSDKLFTELCNAHKLTRSEMRLLKKMSGLLDSPNVASLFILQTHFDEAASAYNQKDPSKQTAAAIESLRGRLFGFKTGETEAAS